MTKANAMHILGVSPGEDERAVKSRFRALIRKYHPDTSDGQDTGIARELIEAYRILL